MMTRAKLAIGSALIGAAMLTATVGPLSAQEPDVAGDSTPMAEQAAMMQGATPETGGPEMEQMMVQCLAMMEMMNSMMGMAGGDMSGMMGGEGMQGMAGMEDMPAVSATPGA